MRPLPARFLGGEPKGAGNSNPVVNRPAQAHPGHPAIVGHVEAGVQKQSGPMSNAEQEQPVPLLLGDLVPTSFERRQSALPSHLRP